MIQYQQPGLRTRGDDAELCRRRMRLRVIYLTLRCKRRESGIRIHFVNQHVAAAALLVDVGTGACVAADDDGSVRSFDPVSESVLPPGMQNRECAHSDARVLKDNPRCNFVNHCLPSVRRRSSRSCDALGDVLRVRVEDAVHEMTRARRAVDVERRASALNPRREDHIGKAERVIGMQMGEENSIEPR